ncbi:hypothetical protein XELAEV_18043349mg [Xenopus laevis]|uniref:Uncharacterized protein n=1 Tax=Xenopus laevis TaxID=8355 RepID=A0A974BXC6_XENLA|nr:hypothetical protein XELAEV_18043349mg [Xenopus laevis]
MSSPYSCWPLKPPLFWNLFQLYLLYNRDTQPLALEWNLACNPIRSCCQQHHIGYTVDTTSQQQSVHRQPMRAGLQKVGGLLPSSVRGGEQCTSFR